MLHQGPPITADDVEALSEYAEDKIINIKAEIVDAAGNKTTIGASDIQTTIDETKPSISSVTSITNGLQGVGDVVDITMTFSEILTLTDGEATVDLDVTFSPVLEMTDLNGVTEVAFNYTVAEGDESDDLTFNGITLDLGALRDVAGNDMDVFTAPAGFNLSDYADISVDGVYPIAFNVDSVLTLGGTVNHDYWNSTNTGLIILIGNEQSDNDASLVGGSIQLLGRIDEGDWQNIGSAVNLVESLGDGGGPEPDGYHDTPLTYDQFPGDTLAFELSEADVESMTDFPDPNAGIPEYNIPIDFTAMITDLAGNSTLGTSQVTTALTVDEVLPVQNTDVDIYNALVPDGGNIFGGYLNSTNTRLIFTAKIITTDLSLVGGNVQVQTTSNPTPLETNWISIGLTEEIIQEDLDAGEVVVQVDTSYIKAAADYGEGQTLYFRNLVQDDAGNTLNQAGVSDSTILIDTTPHESVDLGYSRKYANGELNIDITATFSEAAYMPLDYPTGSDPHIWIDYQGDAVEDIDSLDMVAMSLDGGSYTYSADLPGTPGLPQYDGTASVLLYATDVAGNPIDTSTVTNKDYLTVDNTVPVIGFSYQNMTNTTAWQDSARGGDRVQITAEVSEAIYWSPDADNPVDPPTLKIETWEFSGLEEVLIDLLEFSAINLIGDTAIFEFDMPGTVGAMTDYTNYLTMSINGSDWALNATSSYLVSAQSFTLDNRVPEFTQFSYDDSTFLNSIQLGWRNIEQLDTAWVLFDPVADPGTGTGIELSGDELLRGLIDEGDINNQLTLITVLDDSNTYNIVFSGYDGVGNFGSDTINYVTYDLLLPSTQVQFSHEFITGLDTEFKDTIRVTFNELQRVDDPAPTIDIFFGELDPIENDSVAQADYDRMGRALVDSLFPGDPANPLNDDASVWYYILDNIPVSTDIEGYVQVAVHSSDLAGNAHEQDSLTYVNSSFLDNTIPTSTFSYQNLTQPNLTTDSTGFGIAGDSIRITVSMNEEVQRLYPAPYMIGKYNFDNAESGDSLGVILHDSTGSLEDGSIDSSLWYFSIELKDSMKNDGKLWVDFIAYDRSGTFVNTSVDSTLFMVDNIHPWDTDNLFSIALDSTSFPTDTMFTKGYRVVESWINGNTDSIIVRFPVQDALADPSMYSGGGGDVQVKNVTRIPEGEETLVWRTMGEPDSIEASQAEFRTFARPMSDLWNVLPDGIDLQHGDRVIFRGVLTDKYGNVTWGQSSGMFTLSDDGRLWDSDPLNADTTGYDTLRPLIGAVNGGNFGTVDTLFSTDTLTISWTEFTDPGTFASGFEQYEVEIFVHDTLVPYAAIDSLFGEDTDNDGSNDVWHIIPADELPTANSPFVHDTTMLMHKYRYSFQIRGFDVAGNVSDTLYSDTLVRYNTPPMVAQLAAQTLYEDIAWDGYETVEVSDLDLATLQGDSFVYNVTTTRLIGEPATDNVVTIDTAGVLVWVPTQDDTGSYDIHVVVNDAFSFSDSMTFSTTVIAVNDSPTVAILSPDDMLSWVEDKPMSDTVKINLTSYVDDVDNQDTTDLTWQVVIMDTSELDDDYPLGQIIIGPGTKKEKQVHLVKEFLGFNPDRGVDMPIIATRGHRQSISLISAANPLISVELDSLNGELYAFFNSDSNYYGSNHRVIFIVSDPFGAEDRDTIMVNVLPENDPPVIADIDTFFVNENDSILIDFSDYTSDVDDSSLTFTVSAINNSEYISITPGVFNSHDPGDSVLFTPQQLWSGEAPIQVIVADEAAADTSVFTLDVIRMPRPHTAVSVVQNNAFANYLQIIIVDTVEKTTWISLEIQNERIDLDTIAAYTWSGDFSFGVAGNYSFDVLAIGVVGDTVVSNQFALSAARTANRWYGSSDDGRFSIIGEPGSVAMDHTFLIVDSTLFTSHFTDQASYVLGDESYQFRKPIEVNFGSLRNDMAIYQRDNGVTWKELPSISKNGQIITFTDQTGYFRLGLKTIIVPEQTDLHQNYPNPFNPVTTIRYDIGLMDGLKQKVNINVYNLLGQHVSTMVNNKDQIGQFTIQWDGRDKFGNPMPSGIYFVQLTTDTGIIKNKKMMLLK